MTGAMTNPLATINTETMPHSETIYEKTFLSTPKAKHSVIVSKLVNKNNISNKFQFLKTFFIYKSFFCNFVHKLSKMITQKDNFPK